MITLLLFLPIKNTYSQSKNIQILDLQEALILALNNNPEIKSFASNIEAKDGQLIQSGLFPNSEISVEIENFGGSGAAQDFDQSETTVLLSQLVPISGKISRKKEVSLLNKIIAELEYESKKLDIILFTKKSFLDVLSNQEKLEQIEQLVQIANEIYITISERVEAGKVSPIEEKKSSIELEQKKLLLTKAEKKLKISRKNLSSIWGEIHSGYSKVEGNLYATTKVPKLEELTAYVENNPDIKSALKKQDLNSANINLQRALSIPDPTVGIGYRRLNETNDNAIVAELSVPLPFFNRNQGNIKEAKFNLTKSSQEFQNLNIKKEAKLTENYEKLLFFASEIKTLKESILPQSEDTYSSILEGYREGKFEYLDVLDSQRTLSNSKLQYINALANYHKSIFEIERLTGTNLSAANTYGDEL